jgi:lipoate-protein ligase A
MPPEPAAEDGCVTAAPATFLKVAGNSQRRRRQFLLFHGTLLLDCDLQLISELLPMPSLQPDYRASRPHGEFVANLHLPASAVKAALAQAWHAEGEPANPPLAEIEKLAREKYAAREWNHKF